MADNDYENYSDDDYLAELKDYVDAAKKEKEQDEAERRKQLAEMVGGYMGLWWYLRSFSASTARNIRTYAAIADREAKVAAWKSAADREKELSQYRDLPGSKDQQVMIINEFGACQYCFPYVGKTYSLGDAQTLVPFHQNCRCTLVRVEGNQSAGRSVALSAVASGIVLSRFQGELGKPITDGDIQDLMDYFSVSEDEITLLRGEDVDVRLDNRDAVGSSIGHDIIFLHSIADRATFAEELVHYTQFKQGKITSDWLVNSLEIEAKTYLVEHADVLKLSKVEVDETLRQIKDYEEMERR